MKKNKLASAVTERTDREGRILQKIFNILNKGQTKKVLEDEEIKAEVERLKIEVKE